MHRVIWLYSCNQDILNEPKLQSRLSFLEKSCKVSLIIGTLGKIYNVLKMSQFIKTNTKEFTFFHFHEQKYFKGVPPCWHHVHRAFIGLQAFLRLLVCLVFMGVLLGKTKQHRSSFNPCFFFALGTCTSNVVQRT